MDTTDQHSIPEDDYSPTPLLTEKQCERLWEFITTENTIFINALRDVPACKEAIANSRNYGNELQNWEHLRERIVEDLFKGVITQAQEGLENTAKKLNYEGNENDKPDLDFLKAVFVAVTDNEKVDRALIDSGFWSPSLFTEYTIQIWRQEAERDRTQLDLEDIDPILTPLKEFLSKGIETDSPSRDFILEYISGKLEDEPEILLEIGYIRQAADMAMSNKLIGKMARSEEETYEMIISNFYTRLQDFVELRKKEIKKEKGVNEDENEESKI